MKRLPPFIQALIAGAIAALVTSLLIWVFSELGLFIILGVPVATPDNAAFWMVKRILPWCEQGGACNAGGAAWGLLFLLPVLLDARQWKRGLLFSVVPMAELFLYRYPQGGQGWFGLKYGLALPIAVIVFQMFWGALAGVLFERIRYGKPPEPEEMQA